MAQANRLPPLAPPDTGAARWKQFLQEGRDELKRDYFAHASTPRLLLRQCRLMDSLLKKLWQEAAMPEGAALAAVGGYGRGQLFPHSDVDVLILLPEEAGSALKEKLEKIIGLLWDIGLEVGHSVRTVAQCLEAAAHDVTVQTNLLEARLLCGDRKLYAAFDAALRGALDPQAFFKAKLLEQHQRHMRFHDTAHNLEPNLKDSPGGLRDLQNILWVAHAAGLGNSWAELARRDLITPDEARQIIRHERFLQTLRIRLHYLAGRREDRLLFDFQDELAKQMGIAGNPGHGRRADTLAAQPPVGEERAMSAPSRNLPPAAVTCPGRRADTQVGPDSSGQVRMNSHLRVTCPGRRASEQLMQRFYRTAQAVGQLNAILLQNLRGRIFPAPDAAPQIINERFQARNELLEARSESLFRDEPGALIESFLLLQQHPELKGMSAATLRALWRARGEINAAFRRDPRNRALFMQMLREPAGITREFRRMNQYGILGRYLPAFGRIAGQMQHDLFHAYTVDEHILRVLRNLRRFTVAEFSHEFPLCSRLINDFPRQETLYLAALFHDIAKGRGGNHSLLGARDTRAFCRAHSLPAEDAELVVWLVENHLLMSATAQKQDLSDPDVIEAFAARAGNERRLTALYLLTVADIRGTSPKVWNAWKAKLLEDLFLMARRRLSGSGVSLAGSVQARQEEAKTKLRLYAVPENAQQALWQHLDTAYFLRHDAQEIAWHARLLYYRAGTQVPVVKARLSPIGEGLQVMIYTPDQKDLFARICGFFERMNYNIVEAKIHTTRHGYALDSFQVMDPSNKTAHYRDLIGFVEYELAQRIRTQAPLEPPAQGRVSRLLRHFPITPEVSIAPDDKGVYHVLSVVAGDRPGLLSRIARTLVRYRINLHTAKINTLGERAEDVFLLTGEALHDNKAVLQLENDLLEELQ